jgi:hypothetical protein
MKKYIIIIIIIIGSIPLFSQNYSGGDGTKDNPYQISTLKDLRCLSEKGEADWDKHFIMTNDIDASDTKNWNIGDHDGNTNTPDSAMGWKPIGVHSIGFAGVFDGREFKIINLYINRVRGRYIGFFGVIKNGEVRNLFLRDCNIIGMSSVGGISGEIYSSNIYNCCCTGSITGQNNIGGFCGKSVHTKIDNCYTTCSVVGLERAGVGGFCGMNSSAGTISNSYTYGNVKGDFSVGGFCGLNVSSGNILNCYATGNVSGNINVGGFCGTNSVDGEIANCYALGNVHGFDNAGGFCGLNREGSNIYNSYSIGKTTCKLMDGGFLGYEDKYNVGTFSGNFWDVNASGHYTSSKQAKGKIEGKTTAEMKNINTFINADWDFENIWAIDKQKNNGYPYLVALPVSVSDEEKNDLNFTIYPNPAKNIINIDAEDRIAKIEIYDINGQLLIETFKKQIDVSRLQNGIYQIVLRKSNQIQTKSLIIMR